MSPELTRPLVLEDAIRVPDGSGGFSETWTPLGTIWADMRAGSGREGLSGGVTVAHSAYRITVRAAPHGSPSRPKPEQRFRDGARIFRILAVSDNDKHLRYLSCHTIEETVG